MTIKNNKIYLSPPHMSGEELKLIQDAIKSNWIAPLGPHVDEFEKEISAYIGVKDAAALSSGTAALHLSLKVLGVKKDDFVFCSDLTFVASANAIAYLGAIPIFIDSEKKSWNMCPESLEKAFKKYSPKAVIVTDIYGQSADYHEIVKICEKYSVPIIEDAAESLGASFAEKKCGSFGEMAIVSFNGNKIITTSGGGMLLSNNQEYIKKARKLASQAKENYLHYEHIELGYNYRMSNIIAAIGRAQLKVLDKYVLLRRGIFNNYKKSLITNKNINFIPELDGSYSTRWLTVIQINNNSKISVNSLINHLINKNIEARPVWKPMHLQPLYIKNDFIKAEDNSISKKLFENSLCLPSGSNLSEKDQIKVIKEIKSFFIK
jgi:pyridoxal phosphate-dependent aminotransferase EpsN